MKLNKPIPPPLPECSVHYYHSPFKPIHHQNFNLIVTVDRELMLCRMWHPMALPEENIHAFRLN